MITDSFMWGLVVALTVLFCGLAVREYRTYRHIRRVTGRS